MKKLIDWLLVREDQRSKDQASARIVQKQSRGSISAQNGSVMSSDELREISLEADASLARLNKAFLTTG